MARELCTLADVTAYAPGYVSDATTNALLERLIDAESRSFHEHTRREIAPLDPAVAERKFDLSLCDEQRRMVYVGDLNTITSVEIEDYGGTTLETVASSGYVPLTLSRDRTREEWEPWTYLWFPITADAPAANLLYDQAVLVVNGTWGFRAIPDDVKEAVAAMVLRRYVAEVATAGTSFSEALASVNLTALLTNAREVRRRYSLYPGA